MTLWPVDWRDRARRLADELHDAGVLTDPTWRDAFAAIPRHLFVPSFIDEDDGVIGPAEDEEQWLGTVYSDQALLTQTRIHIEDEISTQELPTSSSSAPSVMAVMLERLDVKPESRVLEIGTGTGYNTALLCHRLSDAAVASVDIDPELTSLARTRLRDAGYSPALAARDGSTGWADHAPYSRIVATCGVTHVPPEWVHQLAEGGRIVAPMAGPGGSLMVLDKTAPDEVTGRFDSYPAKFMPLRTTVTDPLPAGDTMSFVANGMAHYSTTQVDPHEIVRANDDLLLFLLLHLPGLRIAHGTNPDTEGGCLLVHTADTMAEVDLTPLADHCWAVQQRGTHRIWDTVEVAVRAWSALGRPCRNRFGVTALDRIDRQYVWLDDPNGRYSWPLPL